MDDNWGYPHFSWPPNVLPSSSLDTQLSGIKSPTGTWKWSSKSPHTGQLLTPVTKWDFGRQHLRPWSKEWSFEAFLCSTNVATWLSTIPENEMLPSRSWILHLTIKKNTLFIPITKHDFTIKLVGIQSSNHLWIWRVISCVRRWLHHRWMDNTKAITGELINQTCDWAKKNWNVASPNFGNIIIKSKNRIYIYIIIYIYREAGPWSLDEVNPQSVNIGLSKPSKKMTSDTAVGTAMKLYAKQWPGPDPEIDL